MGKANRIRANRVHSDVMTLDTKPQKKGMPNWLLTVIAIVVALAILLSVVGILLSSNGVFGRWTTALSTKNFKVNSNMLSYFFYTNYQNFVNQNNENLVYYGLDTTKSLKEQYVGGQEGENAMTWFDYFMDQTVQSVSSMLVYCEGAREMGMELSDEDHAQIDATIDALVASAEQYQGFYANTNSYISDLYGDGVKVKDIRKAMEYSTLANKYMTELSVKLSDEVKDADITSAFDAKPKKYLVVDYSYYNFETSYVEAKKDLKLSATADTALTDDQKAQIKAKYEELIARVKKAAEDLKNAKTAEEANKVILTYAAEKEVKNAWALQTINVGDNETAVKAAIVGLIVDEIMKGAEEGSALKDNAVLSSFGLEESVIAQLETVKNVAFSEVLSDKKTSIREKVTCVFNTEGKEDDVSKWAFAETAKVGDFKEVKGSSNKEEAESGATFSITAYYLTKTSYKDTEKTRSVAYMLFTDENAAKAAAQAMLDRSTATVADFEAIATEFAAEAHTHLEDYVKGSIDSDKFDTWLFGESTKVGTASPVLKLEDGATYCVALYYAEGHEGWYVSVKNAVATERFDAKIAELEGAFEVTVKEKALDRIEA